MKMLIGLYIVALGFVWLVLLEKLLRKSLVWVLTQSIIHGKDGD